MEFCQSIFFISVKHLTLTLHRVVYLNSRQNDVTHSFFPEQQIDKLVHVRQLKLSVAILNPDFSIIVQQWLKVLVAVQRSTRQPEVVRPERSDISEIKLDWLEPVSSTVQGSVIFFWQFVLIVSRCTENTFKGSVENRARNVRNSVHYRVILSHYSSIGQAPARLGVRSIVPLATQVK